MIDSITLKNMDTSKSVGLSKTLGSRYMLETDGIQWGEAGAIHNTLSNHSGVGNIVTSSIINDRTVNITGRICPVHSTKQIAALYDTSDRSEIIKYKEFEIEDGCAELSRIINPLSPVRIYVGNFYIEGKPTKSLSLSSEWRENNEVYKRFNISLECADPMFYLKSAINTPLSGTTGGFHFPLVITGSGMHFGIVQSYQLVMVKNTSDIESGAIIHIKATGPVDNPVITNVYSQESIVIEKSLEEGETIVIDTTKRKIEGAQEGEGLSSYLSYWNWENTWFQFPVGSSLFGYSADEETYKNMIVWIELQQSIFTLEDE